MWSPREVDPGVQPEGLEGFLEEKTLELNSDSHCNHSRYKSHPCENLLLVRGHLEQGNRMWSGGPHHVHPFIHLFLFLRFYICFK